MKRTAVAIDARPKNAAGATFAAGSPARTWAMIAPIIMRANPIAAATASGSQKTPIASASAPTICTTPSSR